MKVLLFILGLVLFAVAFIFFNKKKAQSSQAEEPVAPVASEPVVVSTEQAIEETNISAIKKDFSEAIVKAASSTSVSNSKKGKPQLKPKTSATKQPAPKPKTK